MLITLCLNIFADLITVEEKFRPLTAFSFAWPMMEQKQVVFHKKMPIEVKIAKQ